MIWTNDYETISQFRFSYKENFVKSMERALDYARQNLSNGYNKELNDFIIIKVENYNCIALVTNEFNPIEICTRIFPFDENQIYPMQEVEQKYNFKIYNY